MTLESAEKLLKPESRETLERERLKKEQNLIVGTKYPNEISY